MPTMKEAALAAATEQYMAELKENNAKRKPDMSIFHPMAVTQAVRTGFTVTLLDGSSYRTCGADFFFVRALSIISDGHHVYFQTTAIKSILIHSSGDAV